MMQIYGRNLPTPTIEKMTLNNVNSEDAIVTTLESFLHLTDRSESFFGKEQAESFREDFQRM